MCIRDRLVAAAGLASAAYKASGLPGADAGLTNTAIAYDMASRIDGLYTENFKNVTDAYGLDSSALFTEFYFDVGDSHKLTLGIRYNEDTKSISDNAYFFKVPLASSWADLATCGGFNKIGSGASAVNELANQTAELLNGRKAECKVYPKQIAFNVLPHIDKFLDNGYTKEEMKMVWETQKIFEDETIRVNPTCVRVPVFFGHSEAVHVETKEYLPINRLEELLKETEGVTLMLNNEYPTPVTHAAGKDPVYVGRLRKDISHENGINMWVVSDNVRKGAALNTVQIAESLISNYADKLPNA